MSEIVDLSSSNNPGDGVEANRSSTWQSNSADCKNRSLQAEPGLTERTAGRSKGVKSKRAPEAKVFYVPKWMSKRRVKRLTPSGTKGKPPVYVKRDDSEELLCFGFPNLQQTCYMNSTLQGLLTLTPFIQEVRNQEGVWRHCSNCNIMSGFVAVECCRRFRNAWRKALVLAAFKDTVARYDAEFEGGDQKDAHEFLSCVLNIVSTQSYKLQKAAYAIGVSYTCPVKAHLAFQMFNTRTCTGCADRSTKEEDYSNLSLDLVPGGSVSDCLQEYLKGSHLEYKCECGAVESTQRFSFSTLPNALILQLKRFALTPWYTEMKLDHPVLVSRQLEVDLDLGGGAENQRARYSLVSVISHLGSTPDSGHYVCDGAQRETSGGSADAWLTYSDSRVWQTTADSVCQKRRRTAYVLFYEIEKQ